ncbi:hypothetical protein J5TS2_21760 [Brevibacillus halotolerans]|nr:hypothetical protein J5TS2_21760 [Brevibacillus halotolerans]
MKGYVIQYFSQFDVLVISILFAFGFLWLIPDMERIHIWMALAIGMPTRSANTSSIDLSFI